MNNPDVNPSTHLHTAPLTNDEPRGNAPRNTSSFFRARRPQVSSTMEPPRANAPLNQPSFFSRTPAATASQSGFAPAPFLPTEEDRAAFDRFRQSARPIQRLFLGRLPQQPEVVPPTESMSPATTTDSGFPFAAAPPPRPSDLSNARPGPDAEIWNSDFAVDEPDPVHREVAAQHTSSAVEEITHPAPIAPPAATVRHYAPVKMIELTDSGLRRNPLRDSRLNSEAAAASTGETAKIRLYETVEMPQPAATTADHDSVLESTAPGPLSMAPQDVNGADLSRPDGYSREAINQYVDQRPEIIETDVETIIPVVEEVVIVERRLLHRENIRIPRHR